MEPARFTRVDATTWRIEPHGAMRVPTIIYADENLIRDMDDKVFEQAVNVATLPGIVQASYAMPDAHWGYGFPIGGVAALYRQAAADSIFRAAFGPCLPASRWPTSSRCRSRWPTRCFDRFRRASAAKEQSHSMQSTWTRCCRAAPTGRWSAVGATRTTSNGSRRRA